MSLSPTTAAKLSDLRAILRDLGSALVCYSGGVDSALLLAVAIEELGDRALAFTTVSPSLAERELAAARDLAERLGARHRLVRSAEVDDPGYASNPHDRCYFCKSELMRLAGAAAREEGLAAILLGTNADDVQGHRPGLRAASERSARHPLLEAGLTKAEVREISRALGLPTWDRPQMACLASRFPYGTAITPERLRRVERFEAGLQDLGFTGTRVRFHEPIARLELSPDDMARAVAPGVRERLVRLGNELGFAHVTVDLAGYRTGSLNASLPEELRRPSAEDLAAALPSRDRRAARS